MVLRAPFAISARLMPAVQVGEAWLSLGYGTWTRDGRMQYDIWIDLPDGSEHQISDLRSGVGGGDIQDGMSNLVGFLSAAGEAYAYQLRTGRASENGDLFPAAVTEWAYQNSDELSMLGLELDEQPDLITD